MLSAGRADKWPHQRWGGLSWKACWSFPQSRRSASCLGKGGKAEPGLGRKHSGNGRAVNPYQRYFSPSPWPPDCSKRKENNLCKLAVLPRHQTSQTTPGDSLKHITHVFRNKCVLLRSTFLLQICVATLGVCYWHQEQLIFIIALTPGNHKLYIIRFNSLKVLGHVYRLMFNTKVGFCFWGFFGCIST